MKPRGFFSPDSSVSSACRVPMPPPPMPRHRASSGPAPAGRLGPELRTQLLRCQQDRARVAGQVGDAVAARGLEGSTWTARDPPPPKIPPGVSAPVAEGVGLVEEDDHPAVAHRQLAQLAEQALDLQDAHAHEHVLEGAGVDEDERLAGLPGHRLGHQRLAGPGRSPQQDAAGHVAALLLDRRRGPRGRPSTP